MGSYWGNLSGKNKRGGMDLLLFEAMLMPFVRYYWQRDEPRNCFLVFSGNYKMVNNTHSHHLNLLPLILKESAIARRLLMMINYPSGFLNNQPPAEFAAVRGSLRGTRLCHRYLPRTRSYQSAF